MVFGKDEAKAKIIEFVNSRQARKLDDINEENTKNHLDDLFRILGWDISMDTVKEESAGRRKRVDYSFKIDGATKFLLEAKAYGKNLDDHINQALNYAYQQNKKWVVLSNLREIRIYNAQYYDKAEEIRLLFKPLKIEEFFDRFDDLWLLSREAFGNNAIDEYAKKMSKIRPTEPIDHKIYEDLMRWRSLLTKSINSHPRVNALSSDPEEASAKIDEAVQKILDRIIFIRVAEDRGLENERSLEAVTRRWKDNKKQDLYLHLKEFFRKMDEVYNSGLFALHYSEDLDIDNEILESIIEETYKSKDKKLEYDFSAINADILGTAYEQYLGTLLNKTAKRASLKSSKAKRKEMGIYYTPIYIVDYIVKNTLGEKLKECKKPEDVLKLKVLDPACGSGSFLIRAYDEFGRWYTEYLNKNSKARQTTLDVDSKKGFQTFMDQVLENCIYGVDLDTKAVEMAQLNLLLKAAEGRHKLPKIEHNIQCGNSLIDDSTIAGKYAFQWEERFPEVFKNGGFDIVIGNPPYLRELDNKNIFEPIKRSKYLIYYQGKMDLWFFFLHRAMDVIKRNGMISFITNSYFTKSAGASKLIKRIKENVVMTKAIDLDDIKVFGEVNGKHIIHFYIKRKYDSKDTTKYVLLDKFNFKNHISDDGSINLSYEKLISDDWKIIFANPDEIKLNNVVPLGTIFDVSIGVQESVDKISKKALERSQGSFSVGEGVFVLSKPELQSLNLNEAEKNTIKKYLNTNDVGKYTVNFNNQYLIYSDAETREKIHANIYPNIKKHLDKFRHFITSSNKPYGLHRPREKQYFENPKIICKGMFASPEFTYDQDKYYVGFSFSVILERDSQYSIKYLLGLLNSKFGKYWFLRNGKKRGVGVDIGALVFRKFPVPQVKNQQPVIILVDKILELNKRLQGAGENTNESARLKEEIKKTDAEIDALVYTIYGVSNNERKIIEDATLR